LGVIVIVGSIVGGIAFANRGNRPASTPAVMVGNDDNQTPTPGGSHDEGLENDTQATNDTDSEHHATESPQPPCEPGDDAMASAEPNAEPSPDSSSDEAEDHCPSVAPEHDD
jgi:hypothetical protein